MDNGKPSPTPGVSGAPARRGHFWRLLGGGVVLLLAAFLIWRPHPRANRDTTFTVRRGTLPIVVVENGSLEAQESQEVRSEVKGWQGTKLLSIIEEGYQVSEEDIRTNRVLVELDSSEIRKNITTSDIDFQAKQSALIEAQQGYEIQLAQNKSDIKSAEQKGRFARLDLEKYLGDQATAQVTRQLKLDEKLAELSAVNGLEPSLEASLPGTNLPAPASSSVATNLASGTSLPPGIVRADGSDPPPGSAAAAPAAETKSVALVGAPQASGPAAPVPVTAPSPAGPPVKPVVIDFSRYAKAELLGDGEAQQKLRENTDGQLLAEKEKSTSRVKMEGAERLLERGFVTRTEAEAARLEYEQVELKSKKAGTALNLFIKYEFPKQAEELLSKYEEAIRVLERTRKEAFSKLAQARAKLKASEQQYRIVDEQRKDLQDQLAKCTIRAKKVGMVIYGGSGDGMVWYGEERIREGAVIRERQPIITIPDMARMAVKVRIHESHIKKVKKGMKARIRVDAQADKQLTGEVTKVGVLPDSQNRWMNPELKLYLVTVSVEGTHDWLKPGMSAKVEILVNELKDVVYVPIQAISPQGKDQVSYVLQDGAPQRRVVETGEYGDEFIEVKQGLKAGELVLLRSPEATKGAEEDKGKEKAKPAESPAKSPAAPAAQPRSAPTA